MSVHWPGHAPASGTPWRRCATRWSTSTTSSSSNTSSRSGPGRPSGTRRLPLPALAGASAVGHRRPAACRPLPRQARRGARHQLRRAPVPRRTGGLRVRLLVPATSDTRQRCSAPSGPSAAPGHRARGNRSCQFGLDGRRDRRPVPGRPRRDDPAGCRCRFPRPRRIPRFRRWSAARSSPRSERSSDARTCPSSSRRSGCSPAEHDEILLVLAGADGDDRPAINGAIDAPRPGRGTGVWS